MAAKRDASYYGKQSVAALPSARFVLQLKQCQDMIPQR